MSDILAILGWATIGALCGVTGGWLMFCYPAWLARWRSGGEAPARQTADDGAGRDNWGCWLCQRCGNAWRGPVTDDACPACSVGADADGAA